VSESTVMTCTGHVIEKGVGIRVTARPNRHVVSCAWPMLCSNAAPCSTAQPATLLWLHRWCRASVFSRAPQRVWCANRPAGRLTFAGSARQAAALWHNLLVLHVQLTCCAKCSNGYVLMLSCHTLRCHSAWCKGMQWLCGWQVTSLCVCCNAVGMMMVFSGVDLRVLR
jgi:hypothetical protein